MGTRVVSSSGQASDMIDTTNVLFICAGSFAGIEEVVQQRKNKNAAMGFAAKSREEMDRMEVYLEAGEEDILDFGIIPELLGRLPVHTTTLPLTEEEMVRVLTEPRNSIIRQFQVLFELDGIELRFDEGALRAIGRKAAERPTGARALRGIVEGVLRSYSYESPSDPTIKTIRVTELAVEGGEAVVTRKDPEEEPEPSKAPLMAAKG
jgi:ATP-dependent Clp protease ATP-binding subunit ClpX